MWFEYLHTIDTSRKRGAARAAATRRKNKQQKRTEHENSKYCAVCLAPYQEFTDVVEDWIDCSKCGSWFHFLCIGIDTSSVLQNFFVMIALCKCVCVCVFMNLYSESCLLVIL